MKPGIDTSMLPAPPASVPINPTAAPPMATPGAVTPGTAVPSTSASELLTNPQAMSLAKPDGTVVSPWCGENGCMGPIGKNGPVTYELYAVNGVSMPVGGSELSSVLKTGYMTGGYARALWYNPGRTSALTFDLGLTYQYNRGQGDKSIDVNTPRRAPNTQDILGNPIQGALLPEITASYQLRALSRTNFNFAVGRDWWFGGPATVGSGTSNNYCFGTDFGGHWGVGHVDLVPRLDPTNYLRRDGVTHGVSIGLHCDHERPMGNWILFQGLRAEWRYTITNLVPPQGGDIHDVNLLYVIGVRF
jgi:hypothetical protein